MKKTFVFFILSVFSICMCAAESSKDESEIHLTATRAMEYAVENSRALKRAKIELETKQDSVNNALNVFMPTVQVSGTLSRSNKYSTTYASLLNPLYDALGSSYRLPTQASTEADYWTAIGQLSVSYNFNASMICQIQQTNLDYQSGLISWDQQVKQTKRDVLKLYYSLLLSQSALENDRQSLKNAKERYNEALRSYENGTSPELNVLQSNVNRKNLELQVQKEELQFNEQLSQFGYVIGLPSDTKIYLEGSLNDVELYQIDINNFINSFIANNVDLRLLNNNLASLDSQLLANDLSTFTPSLSFSYALKPTLYDFDSNWFNPSNWTDAGNFSLTLSWNLTDMLPFSSNRIKYMNLKKQKQSLYLSLSDQIDSIKMEAQKIFDEMELARSSISASEENIRLAKQSYKLVSEAFANGSVDILEVRDAQSQLNQAIYNQQNDYFTYITSLIDLGYLFDLDEKILEEVQ